MNKKDVMKFAILFTLISAFAFTLLLPLACQPSEQEKSDIKFIQFYDPN